MAISLYVFDGGLLTASAAVQGTVVPNITRRVIKAATIINTTGAPIAATVYMVPPGGTPGPSNMIIAGLPIPPAGMAGSSYSCPELINQGLNPGGAIQALGSGLTFKYTATDFV